MLQLTPNCLCHVHEILLCLLVLKNEVVDYHGECGSEGCGVRGVLHGLHHDQLTGEVKTGKD